MLGNEEVKEKMFQYEMDYCKCRSNLQESYKLY
jgi:hypothetical protein